MRVALLGTVAAGEGGALVEVRGSRQQALLALLALHAGEVVSSERAIDELWGDEAPANPGNALQAVVSRLRKVVGDRLVARGTGYVLVVDGDAVDAIRAERLVDEGRAALAAGRSDEAASLLRQALDLWHGPPLDGLADHAFARTAASRLAELQVVATDSWADAELAGGRHASLIPVLTAALQDDPLREGTWARLMLALYRAGRQADALRAFQEAREVLAEQLGVEPGPELRRMEAAVLAQEASLGAPDDRRDTAAAPAFRQPPAPRTSFVGRADALPAIDRLLDEAGLVTLVGPGGVGKTRLATEVARARAQRGERVAFVDLAPLVDEADVAEAVAAAVGARDGPAPEAGTRDALHRAVQHVAGSAVLVLVDNCEHVVETAASAAEALVGAGGRVSVLATSREPLGVPGEQLWPVQPLEPEQGVALFLDRARSVQPGFEPTSTQLGLIREICRRLDGLPLALELAAARTRALPVEEIAARLDDRFRLLTGGARTALPRQQTLRAVVDWSYDLLTEEERHVFARLAAFSGGGTLDDIARVVGGDKVDIDDVPPLVLRLVDRSLVTHEVDPGGVGRFGLLQTLWHHAREQLEAGGDAAKVAQRHARHFTELAEHLAPLLRGPEQRAALDRLEREHENLRSALEWSVGASDRALACRLVAALGWFWYARGHVGEGARWAAAALAVPGELDRALDARALRYGALLGLFAGQPDLPAIQRAVELAREVGDPDELGEALAIYGAMHPRATDAASAAEALDEADQLAAASTNEWLQGTVALLRAGLLAAGEDVGAAAGSSTVAVERYRTCRDDWGLSMALMTRAGAHEAMGHYADALADYSEARDAAVRLGSDELVLHFGIHSGHLRTLAGDAADGRRHHEEAVAAARRIGSASVLAMALNGLGLAARRQGDLAAATAAHAEAHELYQAGGWAAGAALAAAGLGFSAEQAGDAAAAEAHHLAGLALARRTGDERAIALACEGLAGVEALRGRAEQAAALLGHADSRRAKVGAPLPAGERADVDRIGSHVAEVLGDGFEAAMARGREASLDEVLAR